MRFPTYVTVTLLACAVAAPAQKLDPAALLTRSDIYLGQPNRDPLQAMPIGNGSLGVALWSENGLTAQLNRADTMPLRLSTGQLVIPGLKALTDAPDYSGKLHLYDGAFEEKGGGMTLTAWVQPATDLLILDITGADPGKPQTAQLHLWEPRKPQATANGAIGILAESWKDDTNPGHSDQIFGSLSAISAQGRNVSVAVTDPQTVTLTVTPEANGHFRILVASPSYKGQAAEALAEKALVDTESQSHLAFWHNFWHRANLIHVTSPDGAGEYMGALRHLYLFYAAAERGTDYPGSQAGVGDLFSAVRDEHQWDPSAFWHWNLRMQTAANISAGLPELNASYFKLYRDNLASIGAWTKAHMPGHPGICVPETMRFNGPGIEHETWTNSPNGISGLNCAAESTPYYNARTISTAAEVSFWIWQQYLATGNQAFLRENFPVMTAAARFLLSYEKEGADHLNHTSPSNAHENQWDVTDPVTDLSARRTLYANTLEAAKLLHLEPALAAQLQAALPKIPPFPRVAASAPTVLLAEGDTAGNTDIIPNSWRPEAKIYNVENIGLEPLWPYALIGDTSPQFDLEKRTWETRPNKAVIDWSYDPVQAARLHLGSEVAATMITVTQKTQNYINGMARFGGDGKEFYIEQIAQVALGLQEALVQDYDDTIRIAPAIPPSWSFTGTVSVRNGAKVFVQVIDGHPSAVQIETRLRGQIKVRNPWPGQQVKVTNAKSGATVLAATDKEEFQFPSQPEGTYNLVNITNPQTFTPLTNTPSSTAKKLGPVQLGLDKP